MGFLGFKSKKEKKAEQEAEKQQKIAKEEKLLEKISFMNISEIRAFKKSPDYIDGSHKVRYAVQVRHGELIDQYKSEEFARDKRETEEELRAESDRLQSELDTPIKGRVSSNGYGISTYYSSKELEQIKEKKARIDNKRYQNSQRKYGG